MSPSRQKKAERYREVRIARKPYAGIGAKGMIERAFPASWPVIHALPESVKDADGKDVTPSVHNRLEVLWTNGHERVWERAGCILTSDSPEGSRGESNRLPNGKRWPETDTSLIHEAVQEAFSEVFWPKQYEADGREMKAAA